MFRGYDVREKFPKLSPSVVAEIGAAFSNFAGSSPIVLGRDLRLTSPLLSQAFASGAKAAGSEVIDLGSVTTPLLSYGALTAGAFGAMISASHNPPNFNGIKFVKKDGTDVSSSELEKIEKLSSSPSYASWDGVGSEKSMDVTKSYISHISPPSLSLKVALDPGNGSACNLARKVFEKMGCEVVEVNGEPDGTFPGRGGEPTPDNTAPLQKLSKECDFGVAFDGDADRAFFIDDNGKPIRADYVLLLLGQGKRVAATVNCTSLLEKYMEVTRCKIGRTFITEKLREDPSLEMAGEWSGHFWFREKFLFSDGILAAVKLAEHLSSQEKSFSSLFSQFPETFVHHTKVSCPEEKKLSLVSALQERFPDADSTDGVKLSKEDGWVLVRKSNTEPILRVSAEAPSKAEAEKRAEKYASLVENELKSL